ncbi:MAG: hypothetical protein RLZZ200_1231 [Pseudomonadota bacterium]|jgi:enterochelin esterase family protein
MRKTVAFLLSIAVAYGMVIPPANAARDAAIQAEQAVVGLETQFLQSRVTCGKASIRSIFAAEGVFISQAGEVRTRSELEAEVESGSCWLAFERTEGTISLYRDSAVTHAVVRITLGGGVVNRVRTTGVFVKQAGGWRIASWQSTPLMPMNGMAAPGTAPAASSVEVRGSFSGPKGAATSVLSKDADGEWSGSSEALRPDMYSYNFYVDGVPVLDPGNSHTKRDSAEIANTFIVPGPISDLYAVRSVAHGSLVATWYGSPRIGKVRRVLVYTPPGYEGSRHRYPVLYLLHGGMGDEDSWLGNGRAPQILDNLMAAGKVQPMIVVFPNVNATQTASQDYTQEAEPQGSFFNMDFPDSLVTDLVPFIDRTFRTRNESASRAVAGLSMGGAHALWAAFRHVGTFGWVESMSGGYMILPGLGAEDSVSADPKVPALYRLPMAIDGNRVATVLPGLTPDAVGGMQLLALVAGEGDHLLPQQRTLQSVFAKMGVRAEVSEVPGYAHEWTFWRKELVELLPRLFRPAMTGSRRE